MDLRGIYPALTTPFAADGSVALEDLEQNVRRYNTTDVAGYTVLGSTGEAVLLTAVEMDAILATAKESADASKKLIAGTGAESTSETIRLSRRAAELGYHAVLVRTPSYYKPMYGPEVYSEYYRAVADASPIPVLIYSIPQFTGVTLETKAILALAEHRNIAGIKESSGLIERVEEVARHHLAVAAKLETVEIRPVLPEVPRGGRHRRDVECPAPEAQGMARLLRAVGDRDGLRKSH